MVKKTNTHNETIMHGMVTLIGDDGETKWLRLTMFSTMQPIPFHADSSKKRWK